VSGNAVPMIHINVPSAPHAQGMPQAGATNDGFGLVDLESGWSASGQFQSGCEAPKMAIPLGWAAPLKRPLAHVAG